MFVPIDTPVFVTVFEPRPVPVGWFLLGSVLRPPKIVLAIFFLAKPVQAQQMPAQKGRKVVSKARVKPFRGDGG